ncbi:excalibur calcium-binding domain-containing protein [Nocardia transvalensis]|uniref:excalibur calcium-binding domain-containing protein n=1 Tax=Nocardia transvalensis TaxID=37333 RepID=UPI0009FD7E86|nr:excalibur calcium-binding domain-containing protein [Nocardia transvalensis]
MHRQHSPSTPREHPIHERPRPTFTDPPTNNASAPLENNAPAAEPPPPPPTPEPTTAPPAPPPPPPAPTSKPAPTTSKPAPNVYYKSCKEAKAAGATPLHKGQPGYRAGLDGDNNGIACEK